MKRKKPAKTPKIDLSEEVFNNIMNDIIKNVMHICRVKLTQTVDKMNLYPTYGSSQDPNRIRSIIRYNDCRIVDVMFGAAYHRKSDPNAVLVQAQDCDSSAGRVVRDILPLLDLRDNHIIKRLTEHVVTAVELSQTVLTRRVIEEYVKLFKLKRPEHRQELYNFIVHDIDNRILFVQNLSAHDVMSEWVQSQAHMRDSIKQIVLKELHRQHRISIHKLKHVKQVR